MTVEHLRRILDSCSPHQEVIFARHASGDDKAFEPVEQFEDGCSLVITLQEVALTPETVNP